MAQKRTKISQQLKYLKSWTCVFQNAVSILLYYEKFKLTHLKENLFSRNLKNVEFYIDCGKQSLHASFRQIGQTKWLSRSVPLTCKIFCLDAVDRKAAWMTRSACWLLVTSSWGCAAHRRAARPPFLGRSVAKPPPGQGQSAGTLSWAGGRPETAASSPPLDSIGWTQAVPVGPAGRPSVWAEPADTAPPLPPQLSSRCD